jgi:hypothetical protein
VWVAAGAAEPVDPDRGEELGEPVGAELDFPAAVVYRRMVFLAEKDEVVEFGFAVVAPVDHVVGHAPARRAVAAGEGAAAVPGDQCPA